MTMQWRIRNSNSMDEGKGAYDEVTSASLDPDTAEAVEAAQKALTENPGLHVEVGDEAGDAKAMLQAALDDVKNGQIEGEIAHVAAACFGRV